MSILPHPRAFSESPMMGSESNISFRYELGSFLCPRRIYIITRLIFLLVIVTDYDLSNTRDAQDFRLEADIIFAAKSVRDVIPFEKRG